MAASGPILFFADHHGQTGPRAPDTDFALAQLVAHAKERAVAAVVGAGDLIDQPRNLAAPIVSFCRFLDKLQALDIPFYYIQGQPSHDAVDPPWLSSHRHAQYLHRKQAVIGGLRLFGLDFQTAATLQEELNGIPAGTDMLVCHQTWADWMGTIANPQGEFAQVPLVRYVVSGDLHKTLIETKTGKDGQKMRVVSPGATCMQAINEPAEHFCILFDGGSFTKLPLKSRPYFAHGPVVREHDVAQLLAALPDELAAAAARLDLPEALRRPYLRIDYSYQVPDVVRRVEKLVGQSARLFWREIPPDVAKEREAAAAAAAALGAGGPASALTLLGAHLDAASDPDAFELAHALLANPGNQEAALAAWRAAYLGR